MVTDPDYPRMMYHRMLGYTIVNSAAEEIALGPQWSRTFAGGPLKEAPAKPRPQPEPEPEEEDEPEESPDRDPERESAAAAPPPFIKRRRGRPRKGPAAA